MNWNILTQILLMFYFYCFAGWCFESTYVSMKEKRPVNRGFLRGPFLPIYGSGAMVMLFASMPFQDNLILVYLSGCIGATLLEYVTGVLMEKIFQVRYWDYSDKRFQFQGHICLSSTIAWGFLTIVMTQVIQKGVDQVMVRIPTNWLYGITYGLTVILLADFMISFRAAMDLRNLLVYMKKAKEDLEKMQERLDVLLQQANEYLTDTREGRKVEEIKGALEKRFEKLKEITVKRPALYVVEGKEEIAQLFEKFKGILDKRELLSSHWNLFLKNMVRSNPAMISRKYGEEFEEIKQKMKDLKNMPRKRTPKA